MNIVEQTYKQVEELVVSSKSLFMSNELSDFKYPQDIKMFNKAMLEYATLMVVKTVGLNDEERRFIVEEVLDKHLLEIENFIQ